MDDLIQQAAEILHASKRITAFTGAGISAESGVTTYRDKQVGMWEQYNPMIFATAIGYMSDPELAWRWNVERRKTMRAAQPNLAHTSIAHLAALRPNTAVVTQNIDDLHERGGSEGVIHLHGNAYGNKCIANCKGIPTLIDPLPDTDEKPPRCPHCGELIRPDVVWFGEILPIEPVRASREAITNTDVLLVVGLSGAITYGAPEIVKKNNGTVIEINLNESLITPLADIFLQGKAGEIMPQILTAFEELGN